MITLRFLFLYGIYELFAKANGLPLPLNALSNNPSYTNALKVTSEISGWIEFYRAQSIWPEPSFAIFPIILFWVLSDGEDMPIGRFDIALMTVFAAVTLLIGEACLFALVAIKARKLMSRDYAEKN